MFRLLFCFLGIVTVLYIILEAIYNFPIIALDGIILCLGLYSYLLLKKLKQKKGRAYWGVILTGTLISIFNFLPYSVETKGLDKFISTKSVMRALIEYKPHALRVKTRKVKSLFEFARLSKIYFIIFLMKHFYMVFFSVVLISEIRGIPLPFFRKMDLKT